MEEIFNKTFTLLKKAVLENKRVRSLYIDTFSTFEYTYFLKELLGEEARDWNWTPSDASKEIFGKDLISITSPLKEFELRIPEGPFMEFLPDLKFAFSYKKDYKDLRFRFKSNGYVAFTCYEKEDIVGNSVFTTYCPKENFYNLLTVMSLTMTAGVYDKKNLALIKQNFQEGCFYFNLAQKIEEKLPEIKKMYQALKKKLNNNFSWGKTDITFINIINPLTTQDTYIAEAFPEKDVITRYSFCINEYKEGLEFNFKELEEIKTGKCRYSNLNQETKLTMPEFIGIYPNEKKQYPYKVFLRYNYIKEKFKEEVILQYNIKSKKLELAKKQKIREELKKGVELFIAKEFIKTFVEKVGENLAAFYEIAKTKDADMFLPIVSYFSVIRKMLIEACKVALLISKF